MDVIAHGNGSRAERVSSRAAQAMDIRERNVVRSPLAENAFKYLASDSCHLDYIVTS